MLRDACERGDVGLVQLCMARHAASDVQTVQGFLTACRHGHLPVADLLWRVVLGRDVDYDRVRNRAFEKACRGSHFHVAEWLLSEVGLGGQAADMMGYLFWKLAGFKGNLAAAKWLLARAGPAGNDFDVADAFCRACGHGHLDVVQWLFGLGHPEVCAMHAQGLVNACGQGTLDVVKWLVAQGVAVRGPEGDDMPLRVACAYKADPAIVRWLLGQHVAYQDWWLSGACLARLKTWSPARHAWMHSVVQHTHA